MVNKIRLNEALLLMNEKDRRDNPVLFQIAFVKADGELVQLPKAVKCLLAKHLHEKDYVGVRIPNSANHDYPVHIRSITQFNNKSVWF